MRVFKQKNFGKVKAFELGWSPIGRPLMTAHFYIVDCICIDTGIRHMRNEVAGLVKQHQIQKIILTHHHEDHSGNAACLKNNLKVFVYGHPMTVSKMKQGFKILPYQHYAWGSAPMLAMTPLPKIIKSENIELQPIHTPGHSKDHTVFFEENEGWLFSGDLFIAERIKYFRADEKMKDEITSLKKICQLEFDTLFCAHIPKLPNGKQKLSNKLQHLEDLYGTIKDFQTKGLDISEIIKLMGLKESYFMKLFCMGNVSMKNMVRSALVE